jgi:hypothetical protein
MTLYGTPEMAQKMMDNMADDFGVRAMAEGFLGGASSTNGNVHSAEGTNQVDALLSQLGRLVVSAVEKLTGQKVDGKDQADALANAITSNPCR